MGIIENIFFNKYAVHYLVTTGPPFALVTTLIVIAAVAAVVAASVSVIQAFSPPKPPKISFGFQGDVGGSPRYGTIGPLDNTVSNELAVPVVYGQIKMAGNVIWQTDPDETVQRIVAVCEGQVKSLRDVRANDVAIDDNPNATPGSSFTAYLGTGSQKADSRVTERIRPDMELHHTAYLALTLKTSDKLKGGNPTITSICQGLLIKTWDGSQWSSSKSFSRNPAACIRDFLTAKRYGLGLSESILDDDTFGETYEYCEEKVANLGLPTRANASTVAWMHFDGPDDSVVFYDSSHNANQITVVGNAHVSTDQFKFGGASLELDGSGDYLILTGNSRFSFGFNDFTMQGWIRTRSFSQLQVVAFVGETSAERVYIAVNTTQKFLVEVTVGGSNVVQITTTSTLQADTWYHVRLIRAGTKFRFFVDGVQEGGDGEYTGAILASLTPPVYIGKNPQGSNPGDFNGFIDELQIVNGVALSVGDFDAPDDDEARFRLDYAADASRPAQDVINDMLSTFGGFLVYAGSKIKLRVEKEESITQYFGDGSTSDANATFDPNNIVKDSFQWNMSSLDDRANRIRIQWVDPDQNYIKVYTQVEDRIDQDDRGTVITKDVSLLGITRESQASRMAKLQMAIAKYSSISISFSARLESVHCEVGDVIAVTHQSARFTRKLFRITNMQESEDETIRFTCREYNASIYDDHPATAITIYDQPPGPNLYSSLSDVTGLSLTEDNFINKDGVFVTNILTSWTAIADDQIMRLGSQLIQISSDGGANYRDVAYVSAQKTSYKIVLGNVQTGTTFNVRIKTISDRGAESSGTVGIVTISGKRTPPSDVEDFDVQFAFDHLAFSWSAIDDEDLFGYEIRQGNSDSTWETAAIVTTENLGTRYDLFNFTRGTKKFFIKAIDNSGNYSENAASDSIIITDIPGSNVVFSFDLWSRISVLPHPLQGSLSSDLDRIPTTDFDPTYYRLTLQPKTALTWLERQQAGGSWADLQNSGFVFGRESYVTTQESYETDVIDLGVSYNAVYLLDMQTYSSSNLGFVSIQISTSADGITFSSYTSFVAGQYTARYIKFKFLIQATDSETRVRLISALLTVDMPDRDQSFLSQQISDSGTTFNLSGFTSVKSIVITTVGSSNYTPRISDQSGLPNSFTVVLFDTSGVLQAGSVNVYVKGY